MGKYSDSEEESSRRLKKKKKRRSRSRSRSVSSGDSRYSHSHSKHKKSKKKHRQRSKSRSRSSDRHSRRERSPARRRRSRSTSRSRRSRSFDRGRRSRSFERSRRSRSHSRGRRSRSDSRGRIHSRRRSTSRDRGHRSRSRSQSRRSSQERRKGRRSTSPSHTPSMSESNTMDSIPGFADMTPAEQAQARLKLALRAAAAADEKLKDQSTASPHASSSPLSRQEFADAVANIESDAFVPSVFKSSRSSKAPSLKDARDGGELSSHHMAMFGAVGSSVVFTKTEPMDRHQTALEDNPETLFDPCLNVDPEEKMQRWIQKLSTMRRKKLEGDIMGSK